MNISLKDLIGTWRSEIDKDHYFDLTFRENGEFLYDKIGIKSGQRIKSESIIGVVIIENSKQSFILLKDLRLNIFQFNHNDMYIRLQYPNGNKLTYKKIRSVNLY